MAEINPVKLDVFHVFLASPSDMSVERRAVRDFFEEYNRTTAVRWNVRFEVIDWENFSSAGVGKPQDLITAQTLQRFTGSLALVIGLMGRRFGSPAEPYGSGTEAEYEWALAEYRKKGFPEIKWFFRRIDALTVPTDDLDEPVQQFKKVQEFQERVRKCTLCRDFVDSEFGDILRADLSLWLSDPARPWIKGLSSLGHSRDTHAEIDKACVFLREEKPDVATQLLNDLRNHHWDTLTPRERYRILANLGHACRLKGEVARAATFYIDAVKHQPEDESARELAVFAEYLLGNSDAAYRLAGDHLDAHPRSLLALQMWLLNAPDGASWTQLQERVPGDLMSHTEIAWALARRAMQAENGLEAERHARQAVSSSPDNPDAQCLLGEVLLWVQGSRVRRYPEGAKVGVDKARIQEARSLLSQAVAKYTDAGRHKDAAVARLNRGVASQLLGETEAALRDYAAAFELAPDNVEIGRRYVGLLNIRGEHAQLIDLLRRLYRETGDADTGLSLAVALAQQGHSERRAEAIAILLDLLSPGRELRDDTERETIFILAELYAADKNWNALEEFIASAAPRRLDPESELVLKAVAKLRSGDKDGASSYATQALSLRGPSTPPGTGKRLGHLFAQMGMYSEASQSFRNVIEPDHVDDHVRALLRSAHEASEDRFVIDFCASLRSNGILDPLCVQIEASTLERYHAEHEAIRVLGELLDAGIDGILAKQIRLHRSLVALRIDERGFMEKDLSALPGPDEAAPRTGLQMVFLLSEGGYPPEHAAEYAYALFRRHPNDPLSHMAVIRSLGVATQHEVELPRFDAVQAGTAVTYRIKGEGEPRWCIVEDLPDPLRMLGEVAPEDSFAAELMGRRVGDEFITNKGGMQERRATIEGIVHKFVRRFQDCLSGWEERFPGIPFVWRVDIREDEKGVPDFSSVLRSVDQRAEHVAGLDAVYRDRPLPLFALVKGLGGPMNRVILHLAVEESTPIRCCSGSADSIEHAMRTLSVAEAIVLDSTALATILLLDEVNLLNEIPLKCVVSAGTMDELRDWVRDLTERSRDHKVMSKEDDQYVLRDVPASKVEEYRAKISALIEAVKARCTIEPGVALADLPSEHRGHLVELFGQGGAESIALARGKKRVLWTDDFPLGAIASNECSVARVWTQVVVDWMGHRGQIGQTRVDDVSVSLLEAGYFFTSVRPSVVVRAAEKADWDHTARPLRTVKEHLSLPIVDARKVWMMTGQSMALLWRNAPLDGQAAAVADGLLQAIASRADGRKIIDSLHKSLDGFFGLDVVSARKAMAVFENRRTENPNKLVIIP